MYEHKSYSVGSVERPTTIDDVNRALWHQSQLNFYKNRPDTWSHSQYLWHRRAYRKAATFEVMVVLTLRKRKAEIARSITRHNTLYRKLTGSNQVMGW